MNKLRIISLAILAFLLVAPVGLLASDVSDATFYGTVRSTNTGTAATGVSVPFSLSTANLINMGYIENDFSNVAIRDSGGTDVPFMPAQSGASTWITYLNSIGQNQSVNYTLFTGGTTAMGGDIVYFPGAGGMTVPDDASLELGDDFEVEQSINFNTSVAENIISKTDAFGLSGDGAGNISSTIYGVAGPTPVIADTATSSGLSGTSWTVNLPPNIVSGNLLIVVVGGSVGAGGTITPPAGWTELYAGVSNSFKSEAYYRYADGNEGATITVTSSYSTEYASVAYRITGAKNTPEANTATGISSTPDPPSLTASWGSVNNLFIAAASTDDASFSAAPSNYTNFVTIRATGDVGTGLSSRDVVSATENPGVFTASSSQDWVAGTIVIQPADSTLAVTATGVSSGEHVIKVTADTVDLKIYIDGVEEDTVALAGASVPDNANDWVLFENNVALYVYYAKHTVGGSLVGHWYWEYDTTFTDQSGNGNDATPTFRTTSSDADVSAELVTYQAVSSTSYSGDYSVPIPEPIDGAPTASGFLFTELQFDNVPGAAVINAFMDAAGLPYAIFWFPLIFTISAFLAMGAFALSKDLLVPCVVSAVWLFLNAVPFQIVPAWVLFPYAVVAVEEIVRRRFISV